MKLSFIVFLLAFVQNLFGQVTYTKDIAHIVYNKCSSCHRPGEIGPFSLTNYNEVSSYAATIKYVTSIKYMPPWKANPDYQHYLDENYLTDEEITKIGAWVDAGSPYGSAVEEPSFPDFPVGSALGTPDLVLSFATKHIHKGNNKDEYRYFVIPTHLIENKKIKAIELRPGNTKIVHHALFFEDTSGQYKAADDSTPEYGFLPNSNLDVDNVIQRDQYPGYVPGQKPRYYPDGMAQNMTKNSDLVIQMHYAPYPIDQEDSSSVNIFFADENEVVNRNVGSKIMLPFDLVGGAFTFFIGPNQKKTFEGIWTLTQDLSFIGVFPHMHLLGRNWRVWFERPDGSKENLIKIDDWDFNWQGGYYFKQFMIAPKGTKVHAVAEYDNTTSNPNNPTNPPKVVSWGENTTDEMYYLPLLYVPYKSGDENVVFDETTSVKDDLIQRDENRIYSIFPNPLGTGLVNIAFSLSNGGPVNISMLDINGRLMRELRENEYYSKGSHVVHADVNTLPSGSYFIQIKGKDFQLTEKLVVER